MANIMIVDQFPGLAFTDFRHLNPDYPTMGKNYFSGGAGLCSTAYDYTVFMQMFLNGGIYNGQINNCNGTIPAHY